MMDGTYYEVRELHQPRDGFPECYYGVYIVDRIGRCVELELYVNRDDARLSCLIKELTL